MVSKKTIFEWDVLTEDGQVLGTVNGYSKYHAKSVAKAQFKTTEFSLKKKN